MVGLAAQLLIGVFLHQRQPLEHTLDGSHILISFFHEGIGHFCPLVRPVFDASVGRVEFRSRCVMGLNAFSIHYAALFIRVAARWVRKTSLPQ